MGKKQAVHAALLAALLAASIAVPIGSGVLSGPAPCSSAASCPPPGGGYFGTLPVGSWSTLPSGSSCAATIGARQSRWEIRPDNAKRNHVLVDAGAVHSSFASRVRSADGTYDTRWDSWLLPRVDGQFSGSTDQVFQWAGCKWGIADNILRAQAVRESTWYQYDVYASWPPRPNRCVEHWSCGDRFGSEKQADRQTYCDGLAAVGGWDYQLDGVPWGPALCPKTFSILGVMSWENPSWVFPSPPWPGNQNGTFPFTRNATAMAADYEASYLRGCLEGWIKWLHPEGGDVWGCVGSWYSGDWHSPEADGYIGRVQAEMDARTWLTPEFAVARPPCDPTYGCAGPDTLP